MRLLIIDDHDIVRKGIKAILGCDETFEMIEEAATIEEAIKLLTIHQIDIALVDIKLKSENGMDLIEKANKVGVQSKFVIFTSSCRKEDFEHAKQLGVEGYILKSSSIEDIIYGVKSVQRGRKFYDIQITEEVKQDKRTLLLETLTEREREIFREIGKGLSNTQIAEKLYISSNTVKKHMSSLLTKLGLANRTEAALYAIKIWRRKED